MATTTTATMAIKMKPVTVGSLFGSTAAISSFRRPPNLLENTISPIADHQNANSYEALISNRKRVNTEEVALVDNLANLVKPKTSLDANSCLSYYEPELSQPTKVVDEKKSKREQEKQHVLKEIVSSERKYRNDIDEIVEGYYAEIHKLNQDNEEFVNHIFSNIKEILEFTKTFCELLELNKNDEIGVANCFIDNHKTFLKLYSTYCQNYKIAYSTTEQLEYDRVLGKAIQKVRIKYGHSLRVATYLQLPVLRITKYHLLLHRFLKAIEVDTATYKKVHEALELMKAVNDQINKDMPEFSPNEKLSSKFDIEQLTELFGCVLKQGDLILSQTKTTHHVILLQNMLVIRKAVPSNKIMHMIASEFLAYTPKISKTGNKKFQKMFTLIDYSQATGNRMCQFTFKAKTVEEKLSWQTTILHCMLHGYGKKLNENVKSKFMEINNESIGNYMLPTNTSFGNVTLNLSTKSNKSSNFKRLVDFRSSLKTEIKKFTKFDKLAVAKSSAQDSGREDSSTSKAYPHFIKLFDHKLNEFEEPNFTNIVCKQTCSLAEEDVVTYRRKFNLATNEQTDGIDIDFDPREIEKERRSVGYPADRVSSLTEDDEKFEPLYDFSMIQQLCELELYNSSNRSSGSSEAKEVRVSRAGVQMRKKKGHKMRDTPIIYGGSEAARISSSLSVSSPPPFSLMLNNEQMPPELDLKSLLSSSQPSLSSPSLDSEEGYYSHHDTSLSAAANAACDQEVAKTPSSNYITVNTPNETPFEYQLLHRKLAKSTPNLANKNSANLFTFANEGRPNTVNTTRRDVFEYTNSLKFNEASRTSVAASHVTSISDLTDIKSKFDKNISSPTAKQPCSANLDDFDTLSMAEFVNGIYSRSNAASLLSRTTPGVSMEQIIEDDEVPIEFKRTSHLRKSSTFSKQNCVPQNYSTTTKSQDSQPDSFSKLEPADSKMTSILQPVESTLNSSSSSSSCAQSRIKQIQMRFQSVLHESKKVEPEPENSPPIKPARSKSRKMSTLLFSSIIKSRNQSTESGASASRVVGRFKPKRNNSNEKSSSSSSSAETTENKQLLNVQDLINKFENKIIK